MRRLAISAHAGWTKRQHVLILHSANSHHDLVKHTTHSQFMGHSINNMDEASASVVPYETQIGNVDGRRRLRWWRMADALGERTVLTQCPSRGTSRTWRNIWHRGTAGCYRWVLGAVSQGGGGGGGGGGHLRARGGGKCTHRESIRSFGVWFLRVIFGVTVFRLNPPKSLFLSSSPHHHKTKTTHCQ